LRAVCALQKEHCVVVDRRQQPLRVVQKGLDLDGLIRAQRAGDRAGDTKRLEPLKPRRSAGRDARRLHHRLALEHEPGEVEVRHPSSVRGLGEQRRERRDGEGEQGAGEVHHGGLLLRSMCARGAKT